MQFNTVVAAERPSAAPDKLTVFDVAGEQYVFCPVRARAYKVNSKPEELVRQWWLYRLHTEYGYSFDQMAVEVPVKVGSGEAKKAADIVVYNDNKTRTPRIFVEVKNPTERMALNNFKFT